MATVSMMLLGSVALTGCGATVEACPAIGYGSTATITLKTPQPGLTLEVCDGESCSPALPSTPGQTSLSDLNGSSAEGWTAHFILGGKAMMGYRLTDASSSIIDEGYVPVDWVRIDGTEQCGGNQEASVELPV